MSVEKNIMEGLKFAESIRNLDERTSLKITLALAGTYPEIYTKLIEITKTQNLIPPSTLQLSPVPNTPIKQK